MTDEDQIASNKIKYFLKIHSKELRKLDSEVARMIFFWKEVRLVNDDTGDWVGIPPGEDLTIIPDYSSNKIYAQRVIDSFSGSSRLKIRWVNPMPRRKPKSEHQILHDKYFCWEYYSPKTGNMVETLWAEQATIEEAICSASVKLAIFLSRIRYWPRGEK